MIRKGQTTHDLAKALLELPPKKFGKDDDDALVANFADDEDAPEDGGTDIIVREW
jgi:hypothetical protein